MTFIRITTQKYGQVRVGPATQRVSGGVKKISLVTIICSQQIYDRNDHCLNSIFSFFIVIAEEIHHQ